MPQSYTPHQVQFITSAPSLAKCPVPDRPEIVFLGRSNVGKSSLINAVTGRRNIAITSKTPGRTRLINYFDVNGDLYCVDLPGYGFARVPTGMRDEWNRSLYEYLERRENIALAIMIVDARHEAQKNDLRMFSLLQELEVPVFIVATKADKLTKNQLQKQVAGLKKVYGKEAGVLPFSSTAKYGIEEFWQEITRRGIVVSNSKPE
ncbi:ribosome biogenesis GTP-binding protein YihA/YsxC [Desulfurispirillum indicum]|uniref:Probable GTP-binding protein EngB n=1 Tax=Desulfurispirillum indicum (strain ATCC BAA-1389 / DSM 22839 / S5) TaxID=653733 RepID=E6W2R6_DESIS|nr:ribosome biogenesis GTP-binding protein YihA/YsxC [Desulfurispirillum indicum]ADU65650.1 ribosome biogenesis GTP-binding protein YsxC [Desulfurispirillum indicum S5]UCZ57516.1 ribosome biogenesis GTP-binding protein YihA/YsxC [Desulfurispirillum indicum]